MGSGRPLQQLKALGPAPLLVLELQLAQRAGAAAAEKAAAVEGELAAAAGEFQRDRDAGKLRAADRLEPAGRRLQQELRRALGHKARQGVRERRSLALPLAPELGAPEVGALHRSLDAEDRAAVFHAAAHRDLRAGKAAVGGVIIGRAHLPADLCAGLWDVPDDPAPDLLQTVRVRDGVLPFQFEGHGAYFSTARRMTS